MKHEHHRASKASSFCACHFAICASLAVACLTASASADFYVIGGGGRRGGTPSGYAEGGGFTPAPQATAPGSIAMGMGATASGTNAVVSGGLSNVASGAYAVAGGGDRNTASGMYATIGGGSGSIATEDYATVGGGRGNMAEGSMSTIGGGEWNRTTYYHATIAGGYYNSASSNCASVGGGHYNKAQGRYSTIGGGDNNHASGRNATIPGGCLNRAHGNYSFAAGHRANADHAGSFVWGDSTDVIVASTTSNQVVFRCNGGVRFRNTANNQYASWTPGSVSWNFSSDREIKEGFVPVNGLAVLGKVAALPISEWNYIGYEQRHIGPMAQDFHAAFPLAGSSDTSLNSLHLDGVALAAIQGLNQKVTALEEENAALKARLERLEAALPGLSGK